MHKICFVSCNKLTGGRANNIRSHDQFELIKIAITLNNDYFTMLPKQIQNIIRVTQMQYTLSDIMSHTVKISLCDH